MRLIIPRATTAADLGIPETFNAATHFVDRHLREGRGAHVAIECGDERVTYDAARRRRQPLRQLIARDAGRPPRGTRRAAAPRRPGVRVRVLRRHQDRRRAHSREHVVEGGRLPARPERLARPRARRQRGAAAADRGDRQNRDSGAAPHHRHGSRRAGRSRSHHVFRPGLRVDRRRSTPSRPAATRRRSGCIRPAAPARPKAACTCSTTWWSAPSCSRKACSASDRPIAASASPSCSSPTGSATRCTFRWRSARRAILWPGRADAGERLRRHREAPADAVLLGADRLRDAARPPRGGARPPADCTSARRPAGFPSATAAAPPATRRPLAVSRR